MVALPWLVLTTTGSAGRTGLVAFAEMAPLVVAKATAGPLLDRLGSRRVAIACDLASLVVVGLVPLLHAAGALDFATLLVLVAAGGCLRGPGDSAKQAVVPALAEHADVPLERVTGLSGAVERSAIVPRGSRRRRPGRGRRCHRGAGRGRRLLRRLRRGVRGGDVAAARPPAAGGRPSRRPPRARRTSQELRKGWDVVRHDPVLVALTVMVALTNLLRPCLQRGAAAGVGARERSRCRGRRRLLRGVCGRLRGRRGARGLAGGPAATVPGLRRRFLVTGLPRFLVLALGLPTAVVLGTAVVSGLMSGFLNPILGAVIYERIPRPVLGRVLALTSALCWSLIPFGGLLGGGLVAVAGVSAALLAVGCAYLLATMLPVVMPSFRSFDQAPVRGHRRPG